MADLSEWEKAEFKPGELSRWNILFFKVVLAVGISLPILLCGYGIVSYLFFGIR